VGCSHEREEGRVTRSLFTHGPSEEPDDVPETKWVLVERVCEHYSDDWRLVFSNGGNPRKVVELSVTEEQWRVFDA